MGSGIYWGSLLLGIMIGIIIALAVVFFKDKRIKAKVESMADILLEQKNKQQEVKNAKNRSTKGGESKPDKRRYEQSEEGIKRNEDKGETESKRDELSNLNPRDRIFKQAGGD